MWILCAISIRFRLSAKQQPVTDVYILRLCSPSCQLLPQRLSMVSAPKRLDSVEVHNKSATPVSVTVVYDDQVSETKAEITETLNIEAGSSKLFTKILDMGSWTVSCLTEAECQCLHHSLTCHYGIVGRNAYRYIDHKMRCFSAQPVSVRCHSTVDKSHRKVKP